MQVHIDRLRVSVCVLFVPVCVNICLCCCRQRVPQVVLSADGTAAQLVSKYRPPCPVVVVSDSDAVLRGLAGYYALYTCKVDSLQADPAAAVTAGIRMAQEKVCVKEKRFEE